MRGVWKGRWLADGAIRKRCPALPCRQDFFPCVVWVCVHWTALLFVRTHGSADGRHGMTSSLTSPHLAARTLHPVVRLIPIEKKHPRPRCDCAVVNESRPKWCSFHADKRCFKDAVYAEYVNGSFRRVVCGVHARWIRSQSNVTVQARPTAVRIAIVARKGHCIATTCGS